MEKKSNGIGMLVVMKWHENIEHEKNCCVSYHGLEFKFRLRVE